MHSILKEAHFEEVEQVGRSREESEIIEVLGEGLSTDIHL